MKILYLTTESYFKEPIIKSQVVPLLKRMASSKRHPIGFTLITFDDIDSNTEYLQHDPNVFRHLVKRNKGHIRNILWTIYFILLNAKDFDIIHVRSYPPMIAALLAKLFFGKKVIFDPRGLYAEEFSYFENRKVLSKIFKILEKWFCKKADEIVVVSKPFKDYLLMTYNLDPYKIHTISTFATSKEDIMPPSNIENLKTDIFNDKDTLLFVYSGSIENWQLIKEVVAFFQLVKKEISNSKFIFFSHSKAKFDLFLNGKLPADSYFVKSVESQYLSFYLSQCDYGVLFRDNHIINKVSAPIKVKDYLLSGLPIIITRGIGDSSEFVENNQFGLVMENLSSEEMLRQIQVIKNHDLKFDKTVIVERTRTQFHLDVVVDMYMDIYKKLAYKKNV